MAEEEWMPPDEEPADGTSVAALPGTFRMTDLGNAERLVARYRDRIRYCPPRRKWLLWDKTRWRWDESLAVERMAQRTVREIYREAADADDNLRKALIAWAVKSEQAKVLKSMVGLAQSQEGVPVQPDELDADPWLLNADNGTISLRTGELQEHRRADLITRSTGIDYTPGLKSDLWDKVLSDAVGGDTELAQYLQRVIGYSLIGIPLERAFFFLFGPPGTAKSTFIEACHAAMGSYAHSASFETWLVQANAGGNRGDLVRLAGARLVTSVEVRHGAKWDEALVKQVTGGDTLVAAAKYEAEVAFKPAFTLLLAANDAPAAREDDAGLWARMRRIPLTATIPESEQDPTIKHRLKERGHAEAVLSWAVFGCQEYQRVGIGQSLAVQQSTTDYRADLDHFTEFLSDCCEFGEQCSTTRLLIRNAYESWAKEVGRKSMLSAKQIAEKLRARNCSEKNSNNVRYWMGIGLKSGAGKRDRWSDD